MPEQKPTAFRYFAATSTIASTGLSTLLTFFFAISHRAHLIILNKHRRPHLNFSSKTQSAISSASLASAAIAAILNMRARYALQVPEIMRPNQDSDDEGHTDFASNYREHKWALAKQLGYAVFELANISADRYFLLVASVVLFELEPDNRLLWLLMTLSIAMRFLFGLTNDCYEACEQIAGENRNGQPLKPFYATALKYISPLPVRKSIRILGSLEHAWFDDLYPWVLLLRRKDLAAIAEWSWQNKLIAGSLTSAVGTGLLFLFLLQTYLFEGRFTECNIVKQIDDEQAKELADKKIFGQWPRVQRLLRCLVPPLALMHGAADGIPVVFILRGLLLPTGLSEQVRETIALGTGAAVFAGTSLGSVLSEVPVALRALQPEQNAEEKMPLAPASRH